MAPSASIRQLAREAPERRLCALFFLRGINYDRVFECFLRAFLSRGYEVHVLLEREKQGLPRDATRLFDALARESGRFSYEQLPPRTDPWAKGAAALRYAIDYLRYLEPEYRDAHALRERARGRAPRLVTVPMRWRVARARRVRRMLDRILRALERAVPVPGRLRDLVASRRPDVVLVSPLVGLGSADGDYLRIAAALGIPRVLLVASWDNLTNKGVMKDVPTLTVVWNETQVDEAVRLHRLPRDRVVASGAHTFDHWFTWAPSTSRAEFAAKVGLDPRRPAVLYVCSSRFIAGDERPFVAEWLRRLRQSRDPELRDVGVIVRPHPQNVETWRDADLGMLGNVVVWPQLGAAPTDGEHKRDYYDSLYHSSAVVGINTSALIEAAIVRRPVFTILTEEYRDSQVGTLHFGYLAGDGETGVLSVARSWNEHFAQLGEAVRRPGIHAERIEHFLREFVRPGGLDEPAAPSAVDAVERAAATRERAARPGLLALLLRVLTPAVALAGWLRAARRSLARTRVGALARWALRAGLGERKPLRAPGQVAHGADGPPQRSSAEPASAKSDLAAVVHEPHRGREREAQA